MGPVGPMLVRYPMRDRRNRLGEGLECRRVVRARALALEVQGHIGLVGVVGRQREGYHQG